MKANKIIFIISIILIATLMLFGCKQDDTSDLEKRIEELEEKLAEKEAQEEVESPEPEEEAEETSEEAPEGAAEEGEEATEEEEETATIEGQAPTISLAIYQDATYSAADDICYFRIEAKVSGSPTPTISWSKDDSGGSFGNKKAQVNLKRGETYTLTATATNSAGSDTDSITLTWGCDGEASAEEEPEIAEEEQYILPKITDLIVRDYQTEEPVKKIYMGDQYLVTVEYEGPTEDVLDCIVDVDGGIVRNATLDSFEWQAPNEIGSFFLEIEWMVEDNHGKRYPIVFEKEVNVAQKTEPIPAQ
jgi:hypothetical protein